MGLPRRLLLPILSAIKRDVEDIKEAFKEIEMRMVGGSVLIIYEADWERAEEGVKFLEQEAEKDGEEEDDEEDDDDDDDDEGAKKPRAPYIVKLIDFAHTRIKPGEGPDQGVLLGFETVIRLLDGRIKEVLDAQA